MSSNTKRRVEKQYDIGKQHSVRANGEYRDNKRKMQPARANGKQKQNKKQRCLSYCFEIDKASGEWQFLVVDL
jgi:hypothetical protein